MSVLIFSIGNTYGVRRGSACNGGACMQRMSYVRHAPYFLICGLACADPHYLSET